jgi:hypothetical protein
MTDCNTAQDRFDEAGNITNPATMYPRNIQQGVSIKKAAEIEASKGIITKLGSGLKGASNLEDVSSEAVKSSSILGEKQGKGGRSY